MSTELAQDEYEADAEDYELARQPGGSELHPDHPDSDDDEPTSGGTKRSGGSDGRTVFAIDDEEEEDDDDDRKNKKKGQSPVEGRAPSDGDGEGEGFLAGQGRAGRDKDE